MITQTQYTHQDLLNFVSEAQEIHSIWRPQAWYSEEMVDGQQWSESDYNKAVAAGIFDPGEDPMVINRTFPTVQLLLGLQIVNKFNTVVKGRTSKDTEIGQIMTEGISYINDQSGTDYLISRAYKDQIVPGVGFLKVAHNRDPREEVIGVKYRDWKEMWWDPMADPWLDPVKCRYAFHMPYVDLQDLIAAFPQHEEELKNYTKEYTSRSSGNIANIWYDEAQQVEDMKTLWGRGSRSRNRVRPVEMWYPVWRKSLWAKMSDGSAMEVLETMSGKEQFDIIMASEQTVKVSVRRMWTTTFLDNIVLYDGPSPYNHDRYPFVPFVGYLDRYGQPYGVPHQMKGQQVEVNKRRAMILALLRKRRLILEETAVSGKETKLAIDHLTKEANRLDGVLVLADGGKAKIEIIEGTDRNQLQSQLLIQQQSERELQEISGANAEMQGIKGRTISGVAMQEQKQQSSVILAPLLENLRKSRWIMGQLKVAEIQGQWKGPKILRITDRYTGAERFVTLNERVPDQNGRITLQNNVTQGKFDTVISEAPATDTVREANLQLITEAVKKSPPEIIPQLITMAFEMSNLPNKDMLVSKLQQIYKINPGEEDLTPEQLKQQTLQAFEEQQKASQASQAYEGKVKELTLENLTLENQYLQAQIAKIMGDKTFNEEKTKNMRAELELQGFKTGADIADRIDTKKTEKFQAALNTPERKEAQA